VCGGGAAVVLCVLWWCVMYVYTFLISPLSWARNPEHHTKQGVLAACKILQGIMILIS
jgi:hypothetical protein